MKVCKKCNIEKPLNAFGKSSKYIKSYCKSCSSILTNRWRSNNPYQHVKSDKLWKKSKSGVYAIYEYGKCLYVGESTQVRKRISDHKTYIKNPLVSPKTMKYVYEILHHHSAYVIGIVEECSNHKQREDYWIEQLKPLYNSYKKVEG